MTAVADVARAWYEAGCCILPAATDQSKKPGVGSWLRFKAERPSAAILEGWLADAEGIGMVCGGISGNIEMLELEGAAVQRNMHVDLRGMLDAVAPGLWEKINIYSEYTPGGGLHWIFRVDGRPVYGNTKLAREPREPTPEDESNIQTLVETRGEGGWTVLAPSAGRTHPTGGAWVTLSGQAGEVATLTGDEYELLHEVCRALDAMPVRLPAEPSPGASAMPGDESTAPGEDFNSRASWENILTPAGWRVIYRRGRVTYWQRPGKKDRTISASTGHQGDWLYVFSTSTEFESERTYTKFGAWAVLNHGGDYAKAASALRKDGYGSPLPPSDTVLTLIQGGDPATANDSSGEESSSVSGILSDDYNARLLVARQKGRLVYIPERQHGWASWQENRWLLEADAAAPTQAMREIVRAIQPANDAERKHQVKSLSKKAVADAVDLASKDPELRVSMTKLDANPDVLNAPNGIIHLLTGELTPPDPMALHTRLTGCRVDFNRACPRWLAFLRQTFQGNQRVIDYIQKLAGYSATGSVSRAVMPFLYGAGANGKTVLMEVLQGVLGDYATPAPADFLLAGGRDDESAIAGLAGQRLVVCSEVRAGAKFDEAKMKLLTGGDRLKARFLYGNYFTFIPTHHLWLHGNHKPQVADGGRGVWRRVVEIPFLHEVPEEDQIEGLADQLVAREGPGILAWIAEGARLQVIDMTPPPEIKAATDAYAEEEDMLGRFIEERCKIGGGDSSRWPMEEVGAAYREWCDRNGERPLSGKAFGTEIRRRCKLGDAKSNGRKLYTNITLAPRSGDPADLIEDHPTQMRWDQK